MFIDYLQDGKWVSLPEWERVCILITLFEFTYSRLDERAYRVSLGADSTPFLWPLIFLSNYRGVMPF